MCSSDLLIMTALKVVALSGSLRAKSYNDAALRAAASLAPADLSIKVVDYSGVPLYNQDLQAQGFPASVEALRAEIEKLTAPPSSYAIYSSLNADGTANVFVSGRKMKVSLLPAINGKELRRGQEVVLNEALNIIEAKAFEVQGEVVRLKDVLEGDRKSTRLNSSHMSESRMPSSA